MDFEKEKQLKRLYCHYILRKDNRGRHHLLKSQQSKKDLKSLCGCRFDFKECETLRTTETLVLDSKWICKNCIRVFKKYIYKDVLEINRSSSYHKKRVKLLETEINEMLDYRRSLQ